MTHIHTSEIEQFKELFLQEGIEDIDARLKVLETFLATESHMTVDELLNLLKSRGIPFDREFIRSTLKMLCHFGFAQRNRFEDGPVRYEHRHLGQHHDHMVCTKCRKIIEFREDELELLQKQIAAAHGFHMLQHKMEIYGICSDCRSREVELMPLSAARQGETLTIKAFSGGQSRLASLGLRTGDRVEVLTSQGKGQFVIAVEGKRFVLGRGVSRKIMVEPASGQVPEPLPETRCPMHGEKPRAGSAHCPVKAGRCPVVGNVPMESDAPGTKRPGIPLSLIKKGDTATIIRVGGKGPLRRRILEMGLTKGTDIYVEKYAPLKDPVELIVKGYHISLRVEEAAQITVENVRQEPH